MNRRRFVRCAALAAAGNAAGLRPFGMLNAMAAGTAGYKALVCIFLYGGNDANNTLIPFDTNGYANYAALRGPLALAQNGVGQIGALPNYALHPSLSDFLPLINSGAMGLVANVGTLVKPLTRSTYLAGGSNPANLFSHPDQQQEWQNAAVSGSIATGWAGRMSDVLSPVYNSGASIPMITSVAGDTLFCNGASTSPVAVSPGNVGGATCSESASVCSSRTTAAQALLTFSSGVSLVQADNGITADAYKYAKVLADATASLPTLNTVFPTGGMGAQLQQVAQIIQARAALGVQRQIFFCGIGNFDTHATQLATQATLLAGIGPAVAAFYQATVEMGIANDVTSFTMSDFSRTLQPNSNAGSDHGWGSHHFVVGGSVKGGALYGTYPTLALGGPDDSGSNGRWIPSTSSAVYAATLAQWFGVTNGQLGTVFPTLSNFAVQKLGFMG